MDQTHHNSYLTRNKKSVVTKMLLWALGIAVFLAVGVYIASIVSPWPSSLRIRYAFNKDSIKSSRALERYVPADVTAQINERYDPADRDAYLDVFYPSKIANSEELLLTIVWIHGGGWVSGNKNQIANYAKILASKGFTVIGIDYSIAPGATYPTPVRQVNAALSYLVKNAKRLHVNPSLFVLAGDSAGANIAAELANIITVPLYAQAVGIRPSINRDQLAGVLLYCGAYTTDGIDFNGPFGRFQKKVLWSYSGGKDFMTNPHFATAWVINYVTKEFPTTYISAGNADPLFPQSVALADVLTGQGVHVERLFFPDDYKPALPHEYQFNLDTDAGRLALERSAKFLLELKR